MQSIVLFKRFRSRIGDLVYFLCTAQVDLSNNLTINNLTLTPEQTGDVMRKYWSIESMKHAFVE
ncbi:hypothetical protein [Candidatus Enterovibrio escicola]|uniref:hypothetical protein n=1 Tax=Candidatus Enterovibrio escicola TaxID=1927127 RepID=UPI0011BAADF8|nr:hypothetical protein [Candidatus Enterovibrio escacola]